MILFQRRNYYELFLSFGLIFLAFTIRQMLSNNIDANPFIDLVRGMPLILTLSFALAVLLVSSKIKKKKTISFHDFYSKNKFHILLTGFLLGLLNFAIIYFFPPDKMFMNGSKLLLPIVLDSVLISYLHIIFYISASVIGILVEKESNISDIIMRFNAIIFIYFITTEIQYSIYGKGLNLMIYAIILILASTYLMVKLFNKARYNDLIDTILQFNVGSPGYSKIQSPKDGLTLNEFTPTTIVHGAFLAVQYDRLSTALLRRQLNFDYVLATRIIKKLREMKIIGKQGKRNVHPVNYKDFDELASYLYNHYDAKIVNRARKTIETKLYKTNEIQL